MLQSGQHISLPLKSANSLLSILCRQAALTHLFERDPTIAKHRILSQVDYSKTTLTDHLQDKIALLQQSIREQFSGSGIQRMTTGPTEAHLGLIAFSAHVAEMRMRHLQT